MNKNKLTFITVALIVFYLLVLVGWHLYDPTTNFTQAVPGADHRPEGHARKADEVLIGEFFMKEEGTVPSNELKGEWPCFRGASHDNKVERKKYKVDSEKATLSLNCMWTIETGEGHASPVISEGKVYVLDYDEKTSSDVLRCLDLPTGKQLWRRWYRVPMKRNHGFSRTIPAIWHDLVVTIGPEGHVMCCNKNTGDLQWTIDMKKRFGTEIPFWYTGQCPLIYNDALVLAPAGKDTLMVGVDVRTGKTLWGTPNTIGFKMSHSSVMPMTFAGIPTYVYVGVGGVCGVSAQQGHQGQLLWKSTKWQPSVVAPSPLQISPTQVFLVAGYGAGGALLKVTQSGTTWKAEIQDAYKAAEGMSSEQQTPICYEGKLITILPKDGGGMRERLAMYSPDNIHTPIWTSSADERFGLGPYMMVGDILFAFKEDGELFAYRVGTSSMTLLKRQRVMEDGIDAWGPMAYADGYLTVRDSKTIKCLKVWGEGKAN